MNQTLPPKPSLVHLRKQAKELLAALRAGDPDAAERFRPYFSDTANLGLVQAQLVLAREYGFESWSALRQQVASSQPSTDALIAAAKAGRADEVRSLLDAGADPNAYHLAAWGGEKWRETALYYAAGVEVNPEITRMLLDAGADPDDQSIDNGVYRGESLYHSSEHTGKNECMRLILDAGASQVAKDYCIKRKLDFEDIEGVKIYLEYGVNLNATHPRTALSHAVLRGRSLEMLWLLLDAGADPNIADEHGTTAYVLARRLGNKEAAHLLEQHGAKAEFSPHDAILIAAADGDEAKVAELAEAHPEVVKAITDLGRQNSDGLPLGSAGHVLMDLARVGSVAGLRALLNLGADPNMTNHSNETALHWACLAGRWEACRLLVESGAKQDIVERNHNCIAIQWTYWGSQYWSEPYGDYARTVETMLDLGSPLPDRLTGSPAVQEVLRARGVVE